MSKELLKHNLALYKRKFYTNQIIRGVLLVALSIGAFLLIFSTLEDIFWFGRVVRTIFFFVGIGSILTFLFIGVIQPTLALLNLRSGLSNEMAAREIGKHFPEIGDKLVNYLQLSESGEKSSLLSAALEQKTGELKIFSFPKAINFKVNLRFVYYLAGVMITIGLFSFVRPGIFSSSTDRILHFNESFEKPAPFQFILESDLVAFKNDEYKLQVRLDGESIPQGIYLVENNRRFKMNQTGNQAAFSFPTVSRDKSFRIEAAGYSSAPYELKVYSRPEIRSLAIDIHYPKYTRLSDQQISNTGSLIIPEGSELIWNVNCQDAQSILFKSEEDSILMESTDNELFTLNKRIRNTIDYQLQLANEHAKNKSDIRYKIAVIKDEFPELEVNFLPDTVTFKSLFVSGDISDDYGFSRLSFHYNISGSNSYHSLPISFDQSQNNQQFYFRWNFDSLNLSSEDYIQAFVLVADNDGVNGSKRAQSETFYLKMPSEKEIEDLIDQKSKDSENQIEKSLEKAEDVNNRLEELENRLKNKKQLDWQDEKLLEDLIKEKQDLTKQIEELQKKHEELIDSQKEFGKQSQKLQEKAKKLQELMSEVLDEETKKLYDELQNLLKEQSNSEQVLDQLSKIQSKEQNLEKELERAIELFKRIKLETQMEQTAEKLDQLGKEQEELAHEEENARNSEAQENVAQKQEELSKQFDEVKEDMEKAREMNEELKNPEPMEDFDQQEKDISKDLDEIEKDMDQSNSDEKEEGSNSDKQKQNKQQRSQTGQKMKNAGQKMKDMAQQMMAMQQSGEMMMMQENMDNLRDILDNLIKLSFEQENILQEIQEVQQIDPRFIELSQEQLVLISNAEVIEDSLLSLASRVVQISAFVTREVSEINRHMEEAMFQLRERNKGKAVTHQQFAMTSMNNLALLLDDVLQQMQMSMSEAMGKPKSGGKKQQSMPSMSELQKQLSEQIKQLKGSGKSGRELSEELAKLAAEQSELRRQMEQMQQSLEGQPKPGGEEPGKEGLGNNLKEAIEKMEENEVDLVNKRITQQLIDRQQEIITRMLEAEESLREQKQSPEREGETASDKTRKVPPAIEEYLKAKEKEIELLKTIPLDLNPFYKKEVNDYFRRLSVPQQR